MKKTFITLAICFITRLCFADIVFQDSFEYGNTEGNTPVGWFCADGSWVSGHYEHENNCKPRSGDWYAYTRSDEAWIFTPATFITLLHYQISLWAVSDGAFQFEIRYGDDKTPEAMTETLLPLIEINSAEYQEMTCDFDAPETSDSYIGIHVISQGGEALCIDDVTILQTFQYAFEVKALTTDTLKLGYGASATFQFEVSNTGYDTEILTLHGSDEMFTDIHFYLDGEVVNRFEIAPREVKTFDVEATLRDEECPYSLAWIDVIVGSTHNCNTGMVTFYVIPDKPTSVGERVPACQAFPNPCNDMLHIGIDDATLTTLHDVNGRLVMESRESQLDIRALRPGIYFLTIKTGTQSFTQQILKQ